MGNGYTLNNEDLSSIHGTDIFVCNLIHKSPYYRQLVMTNNVMHFELDSYRSLIKVARKMNISSIEALDFFTFPSVVPKVTLVKTLDMLPLILDEYPDANVIYPKLLLEKVLSKRKIDSEVEKGIRHTPHFMLLIGILMGYRKIHLYGLEHNYVKDILNKDPRCGTHFYGDTYRDILEMDRGKGLSRDAYKVSLTKLFEGNAKTFRTYEQLAELAKKYGVEIIDHSNGSLFMFQDYSLWDLVEPKD